ncbi:MAG: hypothetical protein SFT68_00805 [Rickettsiaceae bacterium]|nr:hypothetical protein [Rickettsiaceae bacterium]
MNEELLRKIINKIIADNKSSKDSPKYDFGTHSDEELIRIFTDLNEHLNQGDDNINQLAIKEKTIFVLGNNGTGKGTLINYLAGKQMISRPNGNSWKLEATNPLDGISISDNTTNSDTFFLGGYSPEDKDYTILDSPGFVFSTAADPARENAEAYFRWKVFDKIYEIKIILVLSYNYFIGTDNRGNIESAITGVLTTFTNNQETFSPQRFASIGNSSAIIVSSFPTGQRFLEKIAVYNQTIRDLQEVCNYLRGPTTVDKIDEKLSKYISQEQEKIAQAVQEYQKFMTAEQLRVYHRLKSYAVGYYEEDPNKPMFANNQGFRGSVISFARGAELDNMQDSHIRFFSKHELEGIIEENIDYEQTERKKIDELIERLPWYQTRQLDMNGVISLDMSGVISDGSLKYARIFAGILNEAIVYYVKDKVCANITQVCSTTIKEAQIWSELTSYLQTLTGTIKLITDIGVSDYREFREILKTNINHHGNIEIDSNALGSIEDAIEKLRFCESIRAPNGNKIVESKIFDTKLWTEPLAELRKKIENNLLIPHFSKDENGVIEVKGILIAQSYINEKIRIFQQKTNTPIKAIKIISANTIFFNEDLQYTKPKDGIKVEIISPRWVVETSHKTPSEERITSYAYSESKDTNGIVLDLSGVDGKDFEEEHKEAKAGNDGTEKPRDGARGEDGKPGERGGNGGYFFGVGTEFTNLSSLEVNVSGGNGGKGQDGGKGGNGFKGGWGNEEEVNLRKAPFTQQDKSTSSYPNKIYLNTYISEGTTGGAGGDGGMGGSGGSGGKAGTCYMFSGLSIDKITYTSQAGNSGETGIAGRGGKGGDGGISFSRNYREDWVPGQEKLTEFFYDLPKPQAPAAEGAENNVDINAIREKLELMHLPEGVVRSVVERINTETATSGFPIGYRLGYLIAESAIKAGANMEEVREIMYVTLRPQDVVSGAAGGGAAGAYLAYSAGAYVAGAVAAAGAVAGAGAVLLLLAKKNTGWIEECILTQCPDGKDGESPLEKTPFDEIQALKEYDDPIIRDDNALFDELNEYCKESKDLLGEFFIDSFEN